jgi:serine/threonine protein kinase
MVSGALSGVKPAITGCLVLVLRAFGAAGLDALRHSVDDSGVHGQETGDDLVEEIVRLGVGTSHRVTAGPVWLMVTPMIPAEPALPEHGWKLHVSTQAAGLPGLAETIVPVLVAAGCSFKLARSRAVLADLNDGTSSPASVGKAVTVYPDQRRVVELGRNLARLLDGWTGPRVLSDRRVTPSAPVYYRYGPFAAVWESDPLGRLTIRAYGPSGEVFEGAATLGYRQPPWVTDPFTGETGGADTPGTAVLGGHYEITAGLRRSARGNTYRSVDKRDGHPVVIKQARALVAESNDHIDTRLRLRNERRVLEALAGIAGVPRFLDHFRYGDDEFLVTTDCGPASLAEDVARHGPYLLAAGPRGLGGLAARLARIVSDLHGRGVIMRDLSPGNIVIGDAGPSVVDFGIASYDSLHLPGATPGFAPARQCRGEPPAEEDDYYALGMVLLFAGTGLDPVTIGEDLDQPQAKAMLAIGSTYGERPAGIIGLITDLISDDEAVARTAFGHLLRGQSDSHRPARPLPVIGAFTTELAADIATVLASDLLAGARQILDCPRGDQSANDASIYNGSAGIGLELLRHPSLPGSAQVLADLASFSVAAALRVRLPPGLFMGTTGVRIFLQEATASGIAVPAVSWNLPGPDWQPQDADLIAGAAGTGLGHLWLHRASGDPAHLAVAARCGQALMAHDVQAGTQPVPGVDASASRAHGLAGMTEFLLALAERTGDQATCTTAARRARQLAERTRKLLPAARSSTAAPIAVSWCQGLAGIGQVLLRAGTMLGDPSLTGLAKAAADVCIAYTSRLSALGRCCGAAGVGHFLIDLAVAEQNERYWQAASAVGRHMLLRSGGPPGRPLFVQDAPARSGLAWAFGLAGLLPFFRRFAHQGGPDSLPLPGPEAAAR